MDLAEIEAELAEIAERETFLSAKIKNLLNEEQNLHKSFSCVSSVANELKGVDSEVTTLHAKLEETSALSEKISKRVSYESPCIVTYIGCIKNLLGTVGSIPVFFKTRYRSSLIIVR